MKQPPVAIASVAAGEQNRWNAILNRYLNFLWFADMLIRRYATGKINLKCDLGLKINRIPHQN